MIKKKIEIFKKYKVRLIKNKLSGDGNFDLKRLLTKIKKIGHTRVFLECGANLTGKFLSNNLVDDFHLFMSNTKIEKMVATVLKKI